MATAAWLAGAAAATGGCLVALSLLGVGVNARPTQPMSVSAADRELAAVRGDQIASTPATTPTASPSPTPSPSQQALLPPRTQRAVLTSHAGSVVVKCTGSQAYLLSWSPDQGSQVVSVRRGPAPVVSVTFGTLHGLMTMRVDCQNGAPTLLVHSVHDE